MPASSLRKTTRREMGPAASLARSRGKTHSDTEATRGSHSPSPPGLSLYSNSRVSWRHAAFSPCIYWCGGHVIESSCQGEGAHQSHLGPLGNGLSNPFPPLTWTRKSWKAMSGRRCSITAGSIPVPTVPSQLCMSSQRWASMSFHAAGAQKTRKKAS